MDTRHTDYLSEYDCNSKWLELMTGVYIPHIGLSPIFIGKVARILLAKLEALRMATIQSDIIKLQDK